MTDLVRAAFKKEQEALYAFRKNDVTFDPVAKFNAVNGVTTGVKNEKLFKQNQIETEKPVNTGQIEVSTVEGATTEEVKTESVVEVEAAVATQETETTDNKMPAENNPSTNSKKRR